MQSTEPAVRTSFRAALSANIYGTISGLAIQALTPPILFWVLGLEQYAIWILATSTASYLSLALNGLYYTVMNEVVVAFNRNQHREAAVAYSAGFAIAVFLGLPLCLGWLLVVSGAVWPFFLSALPYLAGSLIQIIGLSGVMLDARLRASGKYAYGTQLLASMRFADWVATIAAAAILKKTSLVLSFLVVWKLATTICLVKAINVKYPNPGLVVDASSVTAKGLFQLFSRARGQLMLSMTTATTVMGPQIVVGMILPPTISVIYTTYRAYFRSISAMLSIVTSASWPLLSEFYAKRQFSELRTHLNKILYRSMAVGLAVAVLLTVLANPVFSVAFHKSFLADDVALCLVAASVLVSCATTIHQSIYLATNEGSGDLRNAFLSAVSSVGVMYIAGRDFGFYPLLFAQLIGDLVLLQLMIVGVKLLLVRIEKRTA
jgi:O-antigen/teichoic acid export membrane protein